MHNVPPLSGGRSDAAAVSAGGGEGCHHAGDQPTGGGGAGWHKQRYVSQQLGQEQNGRVISSVAPSSGELQVQVQREI